MTVTDLHCDTILEIQAGTSIRNHNSETHIDIPRLREGRITLQVFACFIPSVYPQELAHQEALYLLDLIQQTCSDNNGDLEHVTEVSQWAQINGNRIAVLSAVENGHAIDNDLDKLAALYDHGARYMTLTHSKHLEWAASSGEEFDAEHGLSSFGEQVIREMNNMGMMIDVSHVHETTFWDVIRLSKKPIIASHSNVYNLCPTPRNLTDDQIKAIADNGGIIGINFFPGFLDGEYASYLTEHCGDLFKLLNAIEKQYMNDPVAKTMAMRELSADLNRRLGHIKVSFRSIIDHIEYIINLAGEDCVGFGSDFDGIPSLPYDVNGCDAFGLLLDYLHERGYSRSTIEKIAGENFRRVWQAQFA
jgi:membrane dipeptidase